MSDFIVIRLHPVAPVDAGTFAAYLAGLTIRVYDVSVGDPATGALIGQATYVAPANAPAPNPATAIAQHVQPIPLAAQSVATAVIAVATPAAYENLRVEMTRGSEVVPIDEIYYAAAVSSASALPAPATYQNLATPSFYLALPAPANPQAVALAIPSNGQPPSFAGLEAAMLSVLANDPGGPVDIATLAPAQCKTIASEIVWSQGDPLPAPPMPLADLYTAPSSSAPDPNAQSRQQFELSLQAFYAARDARAEGLADNVYAVAAARWCEQQSAAQTAASLDVPILMSVPRNGPLTDVRVAVQRSDNAALGFDVPAEYFYALGARMPRTFSASQRYSAAVHDHADRLRDEFDRALQSGMIAAPAVTPAQAIRRLDALVPIAGMPAYCDPATVAPIVSDWLAYGADDIGTFWGMELGTYPDAYTELVLIAVTHAYVVPPPDGRLLADVISDWLVTIHTQTKSVDALSEITANEWHAFFITTTSAGWQTAFGTAAIPWAGTVVADRFPPFTRPGNADARIAAFVRELGRYFVVDAVPAVPAAPVVQAPPNLAPPAADPVRAALAQYESLHAPPLASGSFVFGTGFDQPNALRAAVDATVSEPGARTWLLDSLRTIDALAAWAGVPGSVTSGRPNVPFSVVEALYARGFTAPAGVGAATLDEFRNALAGTVAYDHAEALYHAAQPHVPPQHEPTGFKPVNPGTLVDCIPPPELSPLGPIAYLHDMLQLSPAATCEDPRAQQAGPVPGAVATGAGMTLRSAVAARRGDVGTLLASEANLETPVPLIDLVNECLENVASAVATGTPPFAGAVYDTAPGDEDEAAALLGAMPEHASPATPVARPAGYARLATDFSSPELPYAQVLDVSRTYLGALGTSRFDVMRTFRKEITEFVFDSALGAPVFQTHLTRFPVRMPIALEYLGISPDELAMLFGGTIATRTLYGFSDADQTWTKTVLRVSEFLARTGLTYCELVELQHAGYVKFTCTGTAAGSLPDCEPCYLDQVLLAFSDRKLDAALRRLILFVRLRRIVRDRCGSRYTFAQLAQICAVLEPLGSGVIDGEFLRQLAALAMLGDLFRVCREDERGDDEHEAAAGRLPILALWAAHPATPGRAAAIERLIDGVRHYATARHGCERRDPDVAKLLAENLDALSALAGFDPSVLAHRWDRCPTHTLRFAEILAKIYASSFTVGELLYLFTAGPHLDGDDPFPASEDNEAADDPLELPDDDERHSLWALRSALLGVDVAEEAACAWTWDRIEASLRRDFGFGVHATGHDPVRTLAERYFPHVLEAHGIAVSVAARRYRTPLVSSAGAWQHPHGFHYDAAAQELWAQLPMRDESLIEHLAAARQLTPQEQSAVRALYAMPRAELAPFVFLFGDVASAERHLIEEPDAEKRWGYFRHRFAVAHARCCVIAQHLGDLAAERTGCAREADSAAAWAVLRRLLADGNAPVTPPRWEDDSGALPAVTWPYGGAFTALLGLAGAGLVREFTVEPNGAVVYRDLARVEGFGAARAAAGAPLPTILPALDATPTAEQARFATLQNGFALDDRSGRLLGGAQGFRVRWHGTLLVERAGRYRFRAGVPAHDAGEPDGDCAERTQWRVTLARGERTWTIARRGAEEEDACDDTVTLRRGAYAIAVEYAHPEPDARERAKHERRAGFELMYAGPDTGDELREIPRANLYPDAAAALSASSLQGIRNTWERAFKAMLFVSRFALSARNGGDDDDRSELGYLLAHGDRFAGIAYYNGGSGFVRHAAGFDFNLLPLRSVPPRAGDDRAHPSPQRISALFDWFERIFDYTCMRDDTWSRCERRPWHLFAEASEHELPEPVNLVRHLGIDVRHAQLVTRYFDEAASQVFSPGDADFSDERWTLRAWLADAWVRAIEHAFAVHDIATARPDLWSRGDPSLPLAPDPASPNAHLVEFVRQSCLHHHAARRYAELQRINDGLRERARRALVRYLCAGHRVPAGAGFATTARDLSDLLLLDVDAGACERASRIEEAISAVQRFVLRARVGLEPAWPVSREFAELWDSRFASFRAWSACKARELHRENTIEWSEADSARESEAFRLLESELRSATLSAAVPGGGISWPGRRPPMHHGLTVLQSREPSTLAAIPPRQGLDLLGTPVAAAQPSWLSAVGAASANPATNVPLWIETAIRSGATFVRVAAAGVPRASSGIHHGAGAGSCCVTCGGTHPPRVDEYVFWLIDAAVYGDMPNANPDGSQNDFYDLTTQESAPWHDPAQLPGLLHWEPKRAVRLAWSAQHGGEYGEFRTSHEAVTLAANAVPDLTFAGRTGDSLYFAVTGAVAPVGYNGTAAPGFRYDLATDGAIAEPQVVDTPAPPLLYPGGLPVFPYFVYQDPGAPLFPASPYSYAMTVACALRARCDFEAALKWYELAFDPLHDDCTWADCGPDVQGPAGPIPRKECCRSDGATDDVARRRSVIVEYVATLLQWGDALMRTGTLEATDQARVVFGAAQTILGPRPRAIAEEDDDDNPQPIAHVRTVADFEPHFAPLNPRLLCQYDLVADRIALIERCANAQRLRSGRPHHELAYFGEREDGDPCAFGCACCTPDPCADGSDWCRARSPYRFSYLLQRAQDLAARVSQHGSALLSAYEKGDAEYLAALRAGHEAELLTLGTAVRQDQVYDAGWAREALQTTKLVSQTNLQYYDNLIAVNLIPDELAYQNQTATALVERVASNVLLVIAEAMQLTPDIFVGYPCTETQLPAGSKLGGWFKTAAQVLTTLADIASTNASLDMTNAEWLRRLWEWLHQHNVLTLEIQQIERQILGAERRLHEAELELGNHQRQREHAAEIMDVLRDKATSVRFYLWQQRETTALYFQMYELALQVARQAERAFVFERGHAPKTRIPSAGWDNAHKGMLAGERLELALRCLDQEYHDDNLREYELTKHISLREHFPVAFLLLRTAGLCEIKLDEQLFDLDYPGQHMRRIASVELTLAAVVGRLANVNCKATLLSSVTRVDPRLGPPAGHCCSECNGERRYEGCHGDPRFLRHYAAREAIATSSGQNDSGLFELRLSDERRLPFAGFGAVSSWRFELSPHENYFDLDTLTDVVFTLRYTAREGGPMLRDAAREAARHRLPGNGLRFFDVEHEFPDEWAAFRRLPHDCEESRQLTIPLDRALFAYLPGRRDVLVSGVGLLFETEETGERASHEVEFHVLDDDGDAIPCGDDDMRCIASAEMSGLYHGVVATRIGPLRSRRRFLATFRFAPAAGKIRRPFLFCRYEAETEEEK